MFQVSTDEDGKEFLTRPNSNIYVELKVSNIPNPAAMVLIALNVVTPVHPGPELEVTAPIGTLLALTPKEAPSATGEVPGVPEWRICGEKQREQ